MVIQRKPILGLTQDAPASKKAAGSLRLAPTVKNDVFLKALLETPTTKHARRSPLEWLGAIGLHIVVVAALIIVPLYTTGTIHLNEYNEVPLIAPPPPPAPPPPGTVHAAPHVAHPRARFAYTTPRLTAPKSIPRTVALDDAGSSAPPDLADITGGVPGGVTSGELGGIGGVFGGTGTTAPPQPRPTKALVRISSLLKAPRQTHNVDPEYPTLAREARIRGVVVVDAIIDEQGNVVQAHSVSGHPLLIAAALKAVLQWKYEPTSLNGRPVSVELQVQVHFDLKE
jgi:periplasmic protein TonB